MNSGGRREDQVKDRRKESAKDSGHYQYECVYLNEFETGSQARRGIGDWFDLYNYRRPHSSLGDRTPMEVYHQKVAA